MPNAVLIKVGTQVIFADHATDFVGGAVGTSLEQGAPLDVQLDLTGLADTTARMSAKVDIGIVRARRYSVMAALETGIATTGEVIELYWAPSPDPVAANGNPGYVTGSDAAYAGGVATLAEGVAQLTLIGVMVCSADATVQIAPIGIIQPQERYGSLVVKNESGAAFAIDAVEHHIVFNPIIDEVQ